MHFVEIKINLVVPMARNSSPKVCRFVLSHLVTLSLMPLARFGVRIGSLAILVDVGVDELLLAARTPNDRALAELLAQSNHLLSCRIVD